MWNRVLNKLKNLFYSPNPHQIKMKNERLMRDILILLDAATKNNSPLKSRIDKLKIQAEKCDAKIDELKTRNIYEYREYQIKIKDLNSKIKQHNKDIKTHKTKKLNCEKKIKRLQPNTRKYESNLQKHKANQESAEKKIQELQSNIGQYNKQIREYESKIKLLETLLYEIEFLQSLKEVLAKKLLISYQKNKDDEDNMINSEHKKPKPSIADSSDNKLEHENIELVSRTIKTKETKRYGSKKN